MTTNISPPSVDKVTVIVVLGAPTTAEGAPGPVLKQRLDRCFELLKTPEHADSFVAVTGSNPSTYGSSGMCREGPCMRDYLVRHDGLPDERIVVEDRAVHTLHNALYVKTLLKARGILEAPAVNLVVLTTDWHMERSVLCFKAIYCDVPNVTLLTEAVPSDPSDLEVVDRKALEKRLIEEWIPLILEREKYHPDMPVAVQFPSVWTELVAQAHHGS